MIQEEFIIINKTDIHKRIEWLEQRELNKWQQDELRGLRILLSKSIPLIPEIEKSWEHGYTRGYNLACCEGVNSNCLTPNKQDYISNLKLYI